MNKQQAIKIVNDYLGRIVLKGGGENNNTSSSNIIQSKPEWFLDIPPKKFSNDLHILLFKKTHSFLWLEIKTKSIKPYETFKLLENKNVFRIYIGAAQKSEDYLVDITSGGTNYNFQNKENIKIREFDY